MRLFFVRFGKFPELNKSKNHLTGSFEKGMSVYEGIERNKKVQILLPFLTYSACVSLSGCIDRKEIYEIIGTVIGCGSDGEPLISNCKIVRQLKSSDFYGDINGGGND